MANRDNILATFRDERGQINLGQRVRERHARPRETFALGFTTHDGTVAAASDWDTSVERKAVRPSRENSIERLLHDCGLAIFTLPLAGTHSFQKPSPERGWNVPSVSSTARIPNWPANWPAITSSPPCPANSMPLSMSTAAERCVPSMHRTTGNPPGSRKRFQREYEKQPFQIPGPHAQHHHNPPREPG